LLLLADQCEDLVVDGDNGLTPPASVTAGSGAVSPGSIVAVEESPPTAPANGETRGMSVFVLAGIGMMNAVLLLVGTGLGWLGDRQLGTTPALLLIGMALGIGCGAFCTYKQVHHYLSG